MTLQLSGRQRKYLRGQAHALKPLVLIGSRGFTDALTKAMDEALLAHELVKAKFNDDKTKAFKHETLSALERSTGACLVGMIGHIAIFYRPHPDPEKRKISVPGI